MKRLLIIFIALVILVGCNPTFANDKLWQERIESINDLYSYSVHTHKDQWLIKVTITQSSRKAVYFLDGEGKTLKEVTDAVFKQLKQLGIETKPTQESEK